MPCSHLYLVTSIFVGLHICLCISITVVTSKELDINDNSSQMDLVSPWDHHGVTWSQFLVRHLSSVFCFRLVVIKSLIVWKAIRALPSIFGKVVFNEIWWCYPWFFVWRDLWVTLTHMCSLYLEIAITSYLELY
jgi:hypothetical protein